MKSNAWIYLLTGLKYPTEWSFLNGDLQPPEDVMDIDLPEIELKLKKVILTEQTRVRTTEPPFGRDERFAFYVRSGEKDDRYAETIASAIMCAFAVLRDCDMDESFTAIGIPEAVLMHGRFLRFKDVPHGEEGTRSAYLKLMRCIDFPSTVYDEVWQILPALIKNQELLEAAHFYRESILQWCVANGDVSEFVAADSDLPTSLADRARVETAYLNAFKAVESLIGEPSKDERKVRARLADIGIDPDEEVGYELYQMLPGKESILCKLRTMHSNRDKAAAHAMTGAKEPIGYCELKDKQAFARHFILARIHYLLIGKG